MVFNFKINLEIDVWGYFKKNVFEWYLVYIRMCVFLVIK